LSEQEPDGVLYGSAAKEHRSIAQVSELIKGRVRVANPVAQGVLQILIGSDEIVVRPLPVPEVILPMLSAHRSFSASLRP